MSNAFHNSPRVRRFALLAVIAVFGAGLSLAAYWALRSKDEHLLGTRLEADAERRAKALERRFRAELMAIHGLSSFVRAGQPGSRDEFDEAAERMLRNFGDLCAVYWVPRVTPDQRSVYLQAADGLGLADFCIRELNSSGQAIPADVPEDRDLLPIYFAAPMAEQRAVLGLHLPSVPGLASMLDEAITTGRVLVSSTASWPGCPPGVKTLLGVRALYAEVIPRDLLEASQKRRDKLLGLVAIAVRTDLVLKGALDDFGPGIDVSWYDDEASPRNGLVCAFRSETNSVELPVSDGASRAIGGGAPGTRPGDQLGPRKVELEVLGHRWSIVCEPTAGYLAEHWGVWPLACLALGLLLTGVLIVYTQTMLGRAEKIQRLVIERTSELDYERFLLETLLNYSPDFIYFKDRDSRFLRISRTLANYIGVASPDDAIGKSDHDFFDAQRAAQYLADERRVMASGQAIIDKDERGMRGNGQVVVLSTTKVPLRNGQGEIIGTFGISRDVTSRKQAEDEAKYEHYLLHTLMDNVPDSIYFKDAEGRYLRVNKAKAERSGFRDPAEAVGKSDADVFPEAHARQAHADELRVIATGQPQIAKEEFLQWPNGRRTWAATSRLPLRDPSGKIIGTFGISHDITAQKEAAEHMRLAKETAEAASRAKSDFLANMSHEIRTPLNAVIGMTELVLDTELSSSQREYLQLVLDSGDSLLSVINDILDFSKIEAGKLTLEATVFGVRESLGDALKSLAFRAHRKGLELAAAIQPDVPEQLVGDAGRLRQVLVNLVGNATKFTETGEVVVEVRCERQTDDHVELHVSVRDTGIGIPADKLDSIFDAFEQVDTSTTRRYGGTGLGLAICARLVAMMGGRIWAESKPGCGSIFHFTVQLGRANGEPARALPVMVQGTRVLVVDDNATNRRILYEILHNWDMRPVLASRVDEALELLHHAFDAGTPIPLVLTDVNMPDVDGFMLAEQIKRDPELGSTVIMMLTSGDRPGEVARCEQLGITSYLLKPIKHSELFDAVVAALGVNAVAEPPVQGRPTATEPSSHVPLRVLLAEDSPVNQKLAVALLEKYGHHVTVVANGREALAAYDAQPFDLILMDVQMPEMDGYDATAAIREQERQSGQHIPIIALTAHAMKGDRERCLAAGMDAYVSKPIRAEQLLHAIAAIFPH